MKKLLVCLVLLLLLVKASAQVSMMDDVSLPYLERLIEIGKANYPKFKWTSAKVDASREALNRAKCGVFDIITISYLYYPAGVTVYENNNVYGNGYQFGLFLNVGSVLQKPATIRGAKDEFKAVKLDKEVIDLDLEQEIRKRYFTYIQQNKIVKLRSKAVIDADDLLKDIKYKFKKGEVSFNIYNQVLLSSSVYSLEKINAESALLIAKTSLEVMVGTTLENIK